MIIDCISDLHGFYPELEGGDLLIIAGDLTCRDQEREYWQFNKWLAAQKYKMKIIIAGNHDNYLYEDINSGENPFQEGGGSYLCDSGTEFEYEEVSSRVWGSREGPMGFIPYEKKKLKIWGSPWTTKFEGINPRCCAFTVEKDEDLIEKWKLIPDDVDILITHSPPFLVLDGCINQKDAKRHCVGSESLAKKINLLKNLKLHIFGHIHENGGKTEQYVRQSVNLTNVKMVNASYVNERYQPVNKSVRVIL